MSTSTLTKEDRNELRRIQTISENIEEATKNVNSLMSKYLDCFEVIDTEDQLVKYIDECLKNSEVSIDTETTGINVYRDKLVGICIYTKGQHEAYIPVNHVDYKTRDRLTNQLDYDVVIREINRLQNCNVIMHNANFDIRVLRRFGIYLKCYWDTMIAAYLLNENERHGLKELYNKYILKNNKDDFTFGKLFSFKGTTFADIPINVAAVYAAHDAKMTWDLKEFQQNIFCNSVYKSGNMAGQPREDLLNVYKVFTNIEMPCVEAICNMEDTGFTFDFNYHKVLSEKYHKLLEEERNKLYDELFSHSDEIEAWRKTEDANFKEPKLNTDGTFKLTSKGNVDYKKSKNEQLPTDDINLSSTTQLSIILYDIFKWPVIDPEKPRGTGEEILKVFDKEYNYEFAKKLLNYRHYSKMVDAFIDSLPDSVEADGKIHCNLNQYGAKTGRMSCSNPNLQQIPSNNNEIRKLFIAPTYSRKVEGESFFTFKDTEEIELFNDEWKFVKDIRIYDKIHNKLVVDVIHDNNLITIQLYNKSKISINSRERYVLIGADYSQQEPKMLATLSQDENMIKDASSGKDIYSAVAARAFNTTYENCLEHFPEGSPIIKHGEKWFYATEDEVKLGEGIKYADGENDTYKDGKDRRTQAKIILLGLMYSRGPSALAEQLKCSIEEAKDIMNSIYKGFPKILECDISSKEFCKATGYTTTLWGRKRRLTDILLNRYEFTWLDSRFPGDQDKPNIINNLTKEFDKNYWDRNKKRQSIDNACKLYRCKIKDNTGFIAQAERQVLNARIQGSAADMTKKAIVKIDSDEQLKKLGFNMIIPIHDEILAQCPLANVEKCKEIFIHDMSTAAEDIVKIKITVDPAVSFEWYGEPLSI